MPDEIRGDRADVVDVHRHRVGGAVAQRERRRGCRRGEQEVDLGVHRRELLQHHRANLQRLAVEGVVVAGREGVGAEHDATLHLGTEAGGSCGGHHLARGRGIDPESVAHTVEPAQVRRRLGRGDQVVRREAKCRRRHRDLDNGGASLFERSGRLVGASDHVGRKTLDTTLASGQLTEDADPHAFDPAIEHRGEIERRLID